MSKHADGRPQRWCWASSCSRSWGSRFITGWLYNGAGSSVLIAGLFHSMHNAIVNSTGLVAVVGLPQFEVLVIMGGIVVLAAAIIAVATRGRLGLNRSSGLGAAR
jgi:hypothetical protein